MPKTKKGKRRNGIEKIRGDSLNQQIGHTMDETSVSSQDCGALGPPTDPKELERNRRTLESAWETVTEGPC